MALERVDEIKGLGVIMDGRMSFLPRIKAIISKLSRMLDFMKRISKEFRDSYTFKTLYTIARPNLEHATYVWSPHQLVHSERLERVQHNSLCGGSTTVESVAVAGL
jgi:hypothetical protein